MGVHRPLHGSLGREAGQHFSEKRGKETVVVVFIQLWPWVQLMYSHTHGHTPTSMHTHRGAPFPAHVKDLYL